MTAAVHRTVHVPSRDGIRLATDIYLPDPNGQFPTLIERTPYARANPRLVAFGQEAAARGYAFVVQDVRGRGDSGGRFRMLFNEPDEGADGEDTLRWAMDQPWCNGSIATVGGSFSAANQQAMAVRRPPGLRAQLLRDAGNNYYRRMLRSHGAANLGVILPWVLDQAISSPEAGANERARTELVQMRAQLSAWLLRLPLRRGESPLAGLPIYEDLYFLLVETSDDGPPWDNPAARLEGLWDEYPTDVSVFLISGWFSHHCAANLEKFRELSARLQRPVTLVIGPWLHAADMLEATVAGDCDFGPAARLGAVDELWFAWLDRSLVRDVRTQSGNPPVRYFVAGTGDGHITLEGRVFHGGLWRNADRWPPSDVRQTSLFLRAGGKLAGSAPITGERAATTYIFDPADPCPGVGSSNLQVLDAPDFVLAGPRVQHFRPEMAACSGREGPLANRPDVLVFETEPLVSPVEVVGEISVTAWVSSEATDADFVARLVDVYPPSQQHPDGCPIALSDGILRMSYRGGRPRAEEIEPGKVYEVEIELSPVANVFKTGHRIRLAITSSAWPQYDIAPALVGTAASDGQQRRPVRQTVYHEAGRASRLVFGCRGDDERLSHPPQSLSPSPGLRGMSSPLRS